MIDCFGWSDYSGLLLIVCILCIFVYIRLRVSECGVLGTCLALSLVLWLVSLLLFGVTLIFEFVFEWFVFAGLVVTYLGCWFFIVLLLGLTGC